MWDVARSVLWWVDSEAGAVFRGPVDGDASPSSSGATSARRSDPSRPRPMAASSSPGSGTCTSRSHGRVVERIRVIDDAVQSRLNDSACDPRGRFLVGSIRLDGRPRRETLLSIDGDRSVRVVADGITVSNGIGFSPDGVTMYHVDSRPGEVLASTTTSTPGRPAGDGWWSSRAERPTASPWT